jgi:hypothetical protein
VGVGHDGIDKVASSWTLRGWSPPWTRAAVTLRGLKSPSTWMYDSTTYRNHGKNPLRLQIAFDLLHLSLLLVQFTFRCLYSRIACVVCYLTCVLCKICQNLFLIKDRIFILSSSLITPPLDTLTFFDPAIGIRALVSIALVYTPLEEDGRVYGWEC